MKDYNIWDDYFPEKRKTTTRKRRSTKTRRSTKKDTDKISALIVMILLFLYMTYRLFILPNIESIKYYWMIVWTILLVLLIIFFIYKINKKRKYKSLENDRIKNIPIFIKDLNSKISSYKPLRYHSKEEPYQMELAWFLRNNYKTLDIEVFKNNSRPDIVIDEIAIEIKWPTNRSELKTIPDKIIRYLKDWDYLFIVLFKVEISKKEFNEWKNDIYETFENKKSKIFIIDL